MRSLFFFILALIAAFNSFAQEDEIGKILSGLKTSGQDTGRIGLLLNAGEYYLDKDNDSAIFYNSAAEQLIDRLKADNYRHRCYHDFVKIYHAKFDNAKAVDYCLKAIEVSVSNKNDFQKASSYRALFSLYYNLRKNDSAIKYSAYAMDLTEKIKDTSNIATMYGNLCRIYSGMELYDKSVEFGKRGIVAGERYKDFKGLLISMNNLGNCYLSLDSNRQAIAIFEKQLVAGKKYKRTRSVLNALINLGVTYFNLADQNNLARVAKQMQAGESEFDESDMSGASYRHLVYGYDHLLNKRYPLAEEQFLKGLEIAERDSITSPMESLYLAMSTAKYAQEDFAAAYVYDAKWNTLNNFLKKEEMAEYALDLETKYGTENKIAKIKLQESQLKQQHTINYILIGSALALLLISALVFTNYRHKQKIQQQRITDLETQQQLNATEAVLKGEEQERTRLAKDLHDGLGGMLSGIKYSFNTMKGNLIMTPENAQAFERSMDMLDSSIKEMRRVAHNMMPEALVKFGLDIALKDFCNDISKSGALQVSYQSIGLDDVVIEQTTAITIYRIVQELINNTMKHAAAKTALVQVAKAGNQLSVTVEDDGKGFDTAVLTQDRPDKLTGRGIGWTNIQSRVEFLKGRLDVNSQPGKGTSVLIELNV